MDFVLNDLLKIEQRLELELQLAYQQLHDVRRLIHQRRTVLRPVITHISPGRLLCEIVQEMHALQIWENEGGAVR